MKATRFSRAALVAALAAAGLALDAAAQPPAKADARPAAKADAKAASLAGDDRDFVMKAAQGGLVEVEAGKVAQSKGQSAAVKSFGSRMVADHGKANEELKGLAKSRNVEVGSALDRDHKAHVDRLGTLSGADFDREYMQHMVADHTKDIAEFEKAAKGAKDSELKAWAAGKLPTLREHLKLAESTHAQVAKGGTPGAAPTRK